MTEDTTTYVIEIKRKEIVGDPSVNIFRITTQRRGPDPNKCSEWPEAFGSVEQLRAYMAGMKSIMYGEGFASYLFDWQIPEYWQEPSGLRFTFDRRGRCEREELRSDGSVIQRD